VPSSSLKALDVLLPEIIESDYKKYAKTLQARALTCWPDSTGQTTGAGSAGSEGGNSTLLTKVGVNKLKSQSSSRIMSARISSLASPISRNSVTSLLRSVTKARPNPPHSQRSSFK
jgi:hypothetical protein